MANSDANERHYKVLVDSFVAEGREFHRGDLLVPSDVPGEIQDLLQAGVVKLSPDQQGMEGNVQD